MAAVISMFAQRQNDGFGGFSTPLARFGRRLRTNRHAVKQLIGASWRRASAPAVDVYALSAVDILGAGGRGNMVLHNRANDIR